MNTPNKITLTRILLIPFIIFFYLATFVPGGKFISATLFLIACLTDFLDGYLARKNNQVTDLGKFFDSIADKILMMTGLILIIGVPVRFEYLTIARPVQFVSICVIIMLAREFIISALRQIAASKGKILAAEWSGKVKATLQFVTIFLYLFYAGFIQDTSILIGDKANIANLIINLILLILLTITTLLTISSGLGYIFKNLHVFADNSCKKTENSENEVKEQEYDSLIPEAMNIFFDKGWASTTLLQKHLGVGYLRASKIVEQMEEMDLISSIEGKTRKILITKEEFEKKFK